MDGQHEREDYSPCWVILKYPSRLTSDVPQNPNIKPLCTALLHHLYVEAGAGGDEGHSMEHTAEDIFHYESLAITNYEGIPGSYRQGC